MMTSLLAAYGNPFPDLFQSHLFNVTVLIVYYTVVGVLTVYGIHRYWLVYTYYKHRQSVPKPLEPLTDWPRLTIQLPVYNERYVVERLIDTVARIEYPRDRLEIQLLDDSTDETSEVARACVARHQALGLPIVYSHRTDRIGFKAGGLATGLQSASGEFIAIFDADFLPPRDFALRTIPYFGDAKIAMVQTRWTYVNSDYSALTEVETILLDGHFAIEQGARSRSGVFMTFNGTAGVWRRTAIDDSGGWQHETLTEDADLSYRAQLRGWKFLFLPDVECPSELPVDMNAFKIQQARWAKGLMQTARKILPRVLRSDVPVRVKAEAFLHLTGNISFPLMVLFSIVLLPAMIVRAHQGLLQTLLIDLPLSIATGCSISAFYLVAQRAFHPKSWKRTIAYLPLTLAVGIGLSVQNARGVIEALLGVKSGFVRTPKFQIEGQSGSCFGKVYGSRAGWMPYVEIAIGTYFAATVWYSFRTENYITIPFLMLFVVGFLYTGILSVMIGGWHRLYSDFSRTATSNAEDFSS